MFRHMVTILRGSWVPDKLLKQCSVLWACADYDRPVWPVVLGIAWVAYKALTTLWGWQPYAETCRGRNMERINKKFTTSLAFVGFLQTVLQDGRFNHQDQKFLFLFSICCIHAVRVYDLCFRTVHSIIILQYKPMKYNFSKLMFMTDQVMHWFHSGLNSLSYLLPYVSASSMSSSGSTLWVVVDKFCAMNGGWFYSLKSWCVVVWCEMLHM
jgi:hypothetical protein